MSDAERPDLARRLVESGVDQLTARRMADIAARMLEVARAVPPAPVMASVESGDVVTDDDLDEVDRYVTASMFAQREYRELYLEFMSLLDRLGEVT